MEQIYKIEYDNSDPIVLEDFGGDLFISTHTSDGVRNNCISINKEDAIKMANALKEYFEPEEVKPTIIRHKKGE